MIKENRFLPWIICFTAALFFFYEFIQMNMFNAIDEQLIQAFSLSATDLGKLSATYFYSNIIFLLFAGSILDRFSTKKVVLLALGICVLGTFAFAWSNSLLLSGICRFFTGIGSAFCFLSCVRLASRWIPASRLAFVIGMIITMAMTGGVVAQTPLALLVESIGWRMALTIDASFGLLILCMILLIVKDYPSSYKEEYQQNKEKLNTLGFWRCWSLAFLNWRNWLAGIYTCTLNLPINILGGVWGTPYLTITKHFTIIQASYLTSALFIGSIIGSSVMGWWSDYIGKRRLPMLIGAVVSLVVSCLVIYLSGLDLFLLLFLFLLLGFVTSTQVISYPTVAERNHNMLTATAVSIVSICAIGGYGVFQPLFGWLMDQKWQGAMVNNVPVYASSDFNWAVLIIPFGILLGFIAALILREKQ